MVKGKTAMRDSKAVKMYRLMCKRLSRRLSVLTSKSVEKRYRSTGHRWWLRGRDPIVVTFREPAYIFQSKDVLENVFDIGKTVGWMQVLTASMVVRAHPYTTVNNLHKGLNLETLTYM